MIAIPTLWTPRNGAWWRLPRLDALFMAHIKKSASTGHLLKTSTGHLTKGCGGYATCCGLTGSGVSWDMTIDATGIVQNDCLEIVTPNDGIDSVKYTDASALDATYSSTLFGIASGDTCIFSIVSSPGRAAQGHYNPGCATLIYAATINAEFIFYKTGANAGKVYARLYASLDDASGYVDLATGWSDTTYTTGECASGITSISFTTMTANYTGGSAPEIYLSAA